MDAPVLLMALLEERHRTLSLLLYTAHFFGLRLAFNKAERGLRLPADLERGHGGGRCRRQGNCLLVEETLQQLASWKGMVPLRTLPSTTGKLSWIAGILPRARWAVFILYVSLRIGVT